MMHVEGGGGGMCEMVDAQCDADGCMGGWVKTLQRDG